MLNILILHYSLICRNEKVRQMNVEYTKQSPFTLTLIILYTYLVYFGNQKEGIYKVSQNIRIMSGYYFIIIATFKLLHRQVSTTSSFEVWLVIISALQLVNADCNISFEVSKIVPSNRYDLGNGAAILHYSLICRNGKVRQMKSQETRWKKINALILKRVIQASLCGQMRIEERPDPIKNFYVQI